MDLISLGPFQTVFDVGANTGQFAREALATWDCTVVSFEPLEEPARILNERASRNPRWITYGIGLDSAMGTREMFRNETSVCSSLLEMGQLHKDAFPFSAQAKPVTAAFDVLDKYVKHIDGRSLLKVDTQGGELRVLQGGGDALRRFDSVLLEVSWEPLYIGAPSFQELDNYLESYGFHHSKRVDEMADPRDGKLLQSDELWEKL